jgi:hypothetical protein
VINFNRASFDQLCPIAGGAGELGRGDPQTAEMSFSAVVFA